MFEIGVEWDFFDTKNKCCEITFQSVSCRPVLGRNDGISLPSAVKLQDNYEFCNCVVNSGVVLFSSTHQSNYSSRVNNIAGLRSGKPSGFSEPVPVTTRTMITFGTSGWRAIIADEFTFANVRLVTRAIAEVLGESGGGRPVIIGFDPRFMAEKFAEISAEVLSGTGFPVIVPPRDTPTPAISVAVRAIGAAGAINFTASHNPPEYCGMKFSTADGAPALPEITQRIEATIQNLQGTAWLPGSPSKIETHDLCEQYLAELDRFVDSDVIAAAKPRIAFDPLYGTGRDYLDRFLRDQGCEVTVLHDWRDPYFGGNSPEPSEKNLADLRQLLEKGNFDLGLSTDGDADRFGILDRDGTFIQANDVLALLLDYLCESRGWREGVGRSVATSHFIDRVAAKYDIPVFETPVGFKYLGELILQNKIILGGEESAGMSIKGHIPEKDGILACLLVTEMVARRGLSLGHMLEKLKTEVGGVHNRRIGIRLTPDIRRRYLDRVQSAPPDSLANRSVTTVDRTDGVKFILDDGSWLLIRLSGTEPLARVYAETNSLEELEVLLESGRSYILS